MNIAFRVIRPQDVPVLAESVVTIVKSHIWDDFSFFNYFGHKNGRKVGGILFLNDLRLSDVKQFEELKYFEKRHVLRILVVCSSSLTH